MPIMTGSTWPTSTVYRSIDLGLWGRSVRIEEGNRDVPAVGAWTLHHAAFDANRVECTILLHLARFVQEAHEARSGEIERLLLRGETGVAELVKNPM